MSFRQRPFAKYVILIGGASLVVGAIKQSITKASSGDPDPSGPTWENLDVYACGGGDGLRNMGPVFHTRLQQQRSQLRHCQILQRQQPLHF